jgi:hypothetical protein
VEVLSLRALNRATLARQLLLERSPLEPTAAVEHLVGLQAQVPTNPHVALWSRLAAFDTVELDRLLEQRAVVRASALRGTIHLVTARDCLDLWPLWQPLLEREQRNHPDFGPRLRDVDVDEPMAWACDYLATPRPLPALKSAFAERFPEHDPAALTFACRARMALVQVPPRGMWGRSNQVTLASAEAWLGAPPRDSASVAELVLRYLAAFGPARPADMATWSRLTGLAAAFDEVRSQLVTFADERGRELFDLPDAPRPGPSTPAPVRFLPEYDNVLLSHDDRSRFVDTDVAPLYPPGRLGRGHVLVDGMLRATWIVTDGRIEVLHLELPAHHLDEVAHLARELSALYGLNAEPRLELAG